MKPKYKIGQILRSTEEPDITLEIVDIDEIREIYSVKFSNVQTNKFYYFNYVHTWSAFKPYRQDQLNLI